eukprot:1495002-Pleurochrysis_carterae.AAC.2
MDDEEPAWLTAAEMTLEQLLQPSVEARQESCESAYAHARNTILFRPLNLCAQFCERADTRERAILRIPQSVVNHAHSAASVCTCTSIHAPVTRRDEQLECGLAQSTH